MHEERPISFVGTTPADDASEQVHEFDEPGVITGALVGTEVGQEYALQNYAEIIRQGSTVSLWEQLDREFLAGNGRDYDLRVRYEFERGDVLRLKAENQNQNGNEYHHAMIIRVDYETGFTERLNHAIRGVL